MFQNDGRTVVKARSIISDAADTPGDRRVHGGAWFQKQILTDVHGAPFGMLSF